MISGRGAKGKIRAPRRNHGPIEDFDTQWAVLRCALDDIHLKNASKLSFEALYRASYKIVLNKKGDELYDNVKTFLESWFATNVMPTITELITTNLIVVKAEGSVAYHTTINERREMGEKFLRGLRNSWQDHQQCMNMTTDVLMYMDRVYCVENRRPSIYTTGMGLFRDHVLRSFLTDMQNATIQTMDIVVNVILEQIRMERDGYTVDRNLMRQTTYMLEGLYETNDEREEEKLYLTNFQPAFLVASQLFYQKECERLLSDADASAWLKQTEKRLLEDRTRCASSISQLSLPHILDVIKTELISKHLQEFLNFEGTGIRAMLRNDRLEDLSILYKHVSLIDPDKTPLKDHLSRTIVSFGLAINESISGAEFSTTASNGMDGGDKSRQTAPNSAVLLTLAAIKWVEDVLLLKDKFDRLLVLCFGGDITIQSTMTRAFSDFINQFGKNSAEYVSLFIDENLKRGIKGKTEAEIDVVLDKATTLIAYISDKDMFETYYKRHLAKRLLHGKSESSDVERQMISRMKTEVGSFFTAKLEGMFKDMALSEELTAKYRSHVIGLDPQDKRVIDLTVNVLTSNFWPSEIMSNNRGRSEDGTLAQIRWPEEILQLQQKFKAFYLRERTGRQLTWAAFIGSADIKCQFPKVDGKGPSLARERRYELNVSTYGMVVLLLFNDIGHEELSLAEIQARTAIPKADLAKLLVALACFPKAKVLNKNPPGKHVKDGDRFSFNDSFHSKAIKIKAPIVMGINKAEGDEERRETEQRNDESRGGVIEAAIVRIMKQRKEYPHQKLIMETITQLQSRFKPDVPMIKKRIESLIEREYLERIEVSGGPGYQYLA